MTRKTDPNPSDTVGKESWNQAQALDVEAEHDFSQLHMTGHSHRQRSASVLSVRRVLPDTQKQSRSCEDYTVGWICALPIELAAAQAMRDEEHKQISVADGDTNSYVLGRIHVHNVVMTCLPQGTIGTNATATVTTNMNRSFPRLRFILLVGVGAGAPDPECVDEDSDIRLGDVVVSKPSVKNGGVIQYNFGKTLQSGCFDSGKLFNKPPSIVRTAVARLEASHITQGSKIGEILQDTYEAYPRIKKKFSRPSSEQDLLFEAQYEHVPGQKTCQSCDAQHLLSRLPRNDSAPNVHYGLIASADQVMRDALMREKMRNDLGIICFEMEAAGLMDECPCLVVRGICDYADSHKNKQWQPYAALTAAAYSKELLQSIEAVSVHNESVIQLADILEKQAETTYAQFQMTRDHYQTQELRFQNEKDETCHRAFKTSNYETHKNINPVATLETCRWVLDHFRYKNWFQSLHDDLLWISADPGCGKSVLSRNIVDGYVRDYNARTGTVCYFFFKDNDQQNKSSTALCAILHQLFRQQPNLIHHAAYAYGTMGDMLQHDTHELWRIIQNAAHDPIARPIVCILDALDECGESDRINLISLLCGSYMDSRDQPVTTGSLKWLVTSRPYDDVRDCFEQIPPDVASIHLSGQEESDQIRNEINLVIHERVKELSKDLRLSRTKSEAISSQLLDMEHRTYLWLYLAVDAIKHTFRNALRPQDEVIVAVPPTVEAAYDQILSRITMAQRKNALAVLTIIVGARRPLHIEEMVYALEVATSSDFPKSLNDFSIKAEKLRDRIPQWCGLFVRITDDRLYLLHQTAKEFLLGQGTEPIIRSGSWKHCLHLRHVNEELAKICVIYLCLLDFKSATLDVKSLSYAAEEFFIFASDHWTAYVLAIEPDLDDFMQSKILELYDSTSPLLGGWDKWRERTYRLPNKYDMQVDGVQLAAYNGHRLILEVMLKSGTYKAHARDSKRRTLLSIAAAGGSPDVVELLLAQPLIDINLGSPLSSAAYHGHPRVVEILLTQPNVDVNRGEPLYHAADKGHREVVELLLSRPDVDVNLASPLSRAASNGHREIVELFIQHSGVDVNLDCPLWAATYEGHKDVVELLLRAPRTNINDGRSLRAAAMDGKLDIVKLLIAQPEINVNLGEPLVLAVVRGDTEMVKVFLAQPDIDVNLGGPLFRAIPQHGEDVVQLLLARPDIDVNHEHPLSCAAQYGDINVVRQLLAHPDIDVNLGAPLSMAAAGGYKEVVELLLAQPEVDINLEDPLARALENGHEEVIELLRADPRSHVAAGN